MVVLLKVLLKKYWSHLFLVIAIAFILLQNNNYISTKKEDEQLYIIKKLGLDIKDLSLLLDSVRELKQEKIYITKNKIIYNETASTFNNSDINSKLILWSNDLK